MLKAGSPHATTLPSYAPALPPPPTTFPMPPPHYLRLHYHHYLRFGVMPLCLPFAAARCTPPPPPPFHGRTQAFPGAPSLLTTCYRANAPHCHRFTPTGYTTLPAHCASDAFRRGYGGLWLPTMHPWILRTTTLRRRGPDLPRAHIPWAVPLTTTATPHHGLPPPQPAYAATLPSLLPVLRCDITTLHSPAAGTPTLRTTFNVRAFFYTVCACVRW